MKMKTKTKKPRSREGGRKHQEQMPQQSPARQLSPHHHAPAWQSHLASALCARHPVRLLYLG